MTKRLRQHLSLLGRLSALLTTSYFLIATSQPVERPTIAPNSQVCLHPAQSVTFEVTGTCGPAGIIQVGSPQDECFVTVAGAAAVGLPASGRFDTFSGERKVDLLISAWTLSDIPPDPANTLIPVPPAVPIPPVFPDAGVVVDALPMAMDTRPDSTFGIVTDASTRPTFGVVDAYSAPTTPIAVAFHPAPQKRECRVTMGNQNKFTCTGAQICAGTLIRR